MKSYHLKIEILDENYTDSLIVSLVRQGYKVWFDLDNSVCISVPGDELIEVKE